MPELIPVLGKEAIERSVADVARKISSDYRSRKLVLIGVLKGAFIFLADLVRHLTIQVKIDFIGASSYGCGTSSAEDIHLTQDISIDVKDHNILVIEDIVDTGLTLAFLLDHLKTFNPRSIRVCTLLDKRERRRIELACDYVGHVIEKGFLVGYGLIAPRSTEIYPPYIN